MKLGDIGTIDVEYSIIGVLYNCMDVILTVT
jgi:hypothetical protein